MSREGPSPANLTSRSGSRWWPWLAVVNLLLALWSGYQAIADSTYYWLPAGVFAVVGLIWLVQWRRTGQGG